MSDQPSTALRSIRTGAFLLVGWISFFLLQGAISIALSTRRPANRLGLIEIELVLGALWALMSLGIILWHRRVRTVAPNLFALIGAHLPVVVLVALIDCIVARMAIRAFTHPAQLISFWAMLVLYADVDVAMYLVVVAVAELLLVRRAVLARQRQAQRLEASLGRARLDYLEAQLQPHFLFNSLGAVSELAYDAPATANRVIRQLAAIFRSALRNKSDEITLGEEIVGIEPYLDIQRIRFADWLTIDYRVDENAVDCLVPRFVLQPLVENAIRHGLSGRRSAGTIEISARMTANTLVVRVADNGVGLETRSSSAGRGIGLANVRDRLLILYGDDDRLRLSSGEGGGTVAELTIPARRRDDAPQSGSRLDDAGPMSHESQVQTVRIPRWLHHPVAAIGLTWLAYGILWTQQSFLYLQMRGRLGESTWMSIARNDMLSAVIWALLTPIVLFGARRVPLQRPQLAVRVLGYVLAGCAVTLIHAAAWQRIAQPGQSFWSSSYQSTLVIGLLIFSIIAAVGHRRVLAEWLRSREAAAVALRAELEDAQQRAAKLQSIPPVLLRSLDGIAESARRDPGLTERQLTRLGDYLRVALECGDMRGITPERELALEAALAALRQTGAYTQDLTMSA